MFPIAYLRQVLFVATPAFISNMVDLDELDIAENNTEDYYKINLQRAHQ